MELVNVSGCDNCPFLVANFKSTCIHPDFNDAEEGDGRVLTEEEDEQVTPEWCPLKKASLTIKLDSYVKDEERIGS